MGIKGKYEEDLKRKQAEYRAFIRTYEAWLEYLNAYGK